MADACPKDEAAVTFKDEARQRPLRHKTAALYGVGSIGTATFVIVPQLYLLFFMTETLAIPAGYATLVLLLPKLWEFVFDPAVGGLSDRLSGRWGRRLPPMLLGAPLFGVGFALLFAPPSASTPALQAAIVCGIYLVCTSAYALYSVPYITVPAELPALGADRVRAVAWRTGFVSVGVLFAGVSAPLLVERLGSGRDGFAGMGFVLAAISVATMLAATLAMRSMPSLPAAGGHTPLMRQLRIALANAPFVRLWLTYLVQLVATAVTLAVLPYFVKYVLQADDDLVTVAFAVFTATSLLFLPATAWLARRTGQRRAYAAASVVYAAGQLAVLLSAAPGRTTELLIAFAVIGVGNAGQQLLPFAMLPRAIDHDRRATGANREGAYTGFWIAGEKLGLALGGALAAGLLAVAGLVEHVGQGAAQPASAITAMVWQMSLLPAALFLLSLAPLAGFDRALAKGDPA